MAPATELRSWVQTTTRSFFINQGNYGIKLNLLLTIVGEIQQQWFFNNFHMIMATEDATKKLKFSSVFILE
jgi:hypothetical protein